jgi:peroxiredoxin
VRFALVILALVLAGVNPALAEMTGGLTVGDVAPDANVTPLGATAAGAISGIQGQGKVLLLEIFQVGCPHCQHETKDLNEVFAKVDANKVAIVSVALGETDKWVQRFKTQFDVKYPLYVDAKSQTQRPFNIQAVPSYFIIDAKRVIRFEGHTQTAAKLIEQLEAASH